VVPGPVLNTVMTSMLTSVADLVWETTLIARPGPTLRGDKEIRMPRKRSKAVSLPIVELAAAGIDVGATQIFVAVPADRDSEPVRCFQTFTVDLHRLAEWLQQCGIRTVAMESTGVYWSARHLALMDLAFRELAQRFSLRQLAEHQGYELSPTAEAARVPLDRTGESD
jgi:hypothetical protein